MSSAHVAYESDLKEMQQIVDYSLKTINNIIKMWDGTIKIQGETRDKIITPLPVLPTSQAKKGFLSKMREQTYDFPDMERQFSDTWNSLMINQFIQPPGMNELVTSFRDDIMKQLIQVRDDYQQRFERATQYFNVTYEQFKNAQDAYFSCFLSYRTLYDQIEDVKNRMSTRPDPKLPVQYADLKNQFRDLQETCVAKLNEVNTNFLTYSTQMEEHMLNFEYLDKMLFEKLQKVHETINNAIKQHGVLLNSAIESMSSIVTSKIFHDMDRMLNEKNIFPTPNEKIIQIDYRPPKLPFDVSQYQNPKKMFGDEIKYCCATIKNNYQASATDEISVAAGEPVIFKEVKRKRVLIFSEKTKREGYVPENIIERDRTSGRKLYRINAEFKSPNGDFQVVKDEIVLGIRHLSNSTICQNMYGETCELPKNILRDAK